MKCGAQGIIAKEKGTEGSERLKPADRHTDEPSRKSRKMEGEHTFLRDHVSWWRWRGGRQVESDRGMGEGSREQQRTEETRKVHSFGSSSGVHGALCPVLGTGLRQNC